MLITLHSDFEANYYEGMEGEDNLTPEGQRTLEHLENLLLNGQGQGDGQNRPNGQSITTVIIIKHGFDFFYNFEGLRYHQRMELFILFTKSKSKD